MNDTASAAPVRDYPPLPDFETVEQHIYGACRRYITQDMLEPIHNLIRDAIDADRAMRAQAAPAAVASPLTKLQRKAIDVCFTSDKVSVSEVQRKLSISYADAQTLCQSIVDLGLTDELELAPSLKRGAPAPHPAPVAQGDAEDAARYRFLAGHCRSTSEHWGGRWSIIVDGPAPKSHDSEDDFDEAVDAARKQGSNHA